MRCLTRGPVIALASAASRPNVERAMVIEMALFLVVVLTMNAAESAGRHRNRCEIELENMNRMIIKESEVSKISSTIRSLLSKSFIDKLRQHTGHLGSHLFTLHHIFLFA